MSALANIGDLVVNYEDTLPELAFKIITQLIYDERVEIALHDIEFVWHLLKLDQYSTKDYYGFQLFYDIYTHDQVLSQSESVHMAAIDSSDLQLMVEKSKHVDCGKRRKESRYLLEDFYGDHNSFLEDGIHAVIFKNERILWEISFGDRSVSALAMSTTENRKISSTLYHARNKGSLYVNPTYPVEGKNPGSCDCNFELLLLGPNLHKFVPLCKGGLDFLVAKPEVNVDLSVRNSNNHNRKS